MPKLPKRSNNLLSELVIATRVVLLFQLIRTSGCCINYIVDKDYRLHDHVLTTFNVTWDWGCAEKCQQDPWCHSFNLQRRNPTGSHFLMCEINSATRVSRQNSYYHEPGFFYHELQYPAQDSSFAVVECMPGEPSCFKFFTGVKKSWQEANLTCQQDGASLALLKTTDKIDFVKRKLLASQGVTSFWIGLHDLDNDRTFQWADGTPLTTHDWQNGQPYHPVSIPTCVQLVANYKWGDADCAANAIFICERNYY